jgi:hypothetical protein
MPAFYAFADVYPHDFDANRLHAYAPGHVTMQTR